MWAAAIPMAMAIFSAPTAAQDDARRAIEEIIVYGENLERRLLDSSTSVNVQTAEMLERSSDADIQDIFRRTASVAATGAGVQTFDFSIRGISTNGVGGAGQEGLASIVIDGANTTRVQSARGITSLFDVEQVEILRGPQSTNQGKNSLAGAVIVHTKDPEFQQRTHLRAEYGEFNSYQAALANTGGLSDVLAYRATVDYRHSDGFIDNKARNEDDYTEDDTLTARLKLLYESDSPLRVLLSHTLMRAENNNDIESYDPSSERFVSFNPYPSRMKTDQDLTALEVSYGLSEQWSINSVTTFNTFESNDRNNAYAVTLPTPDQVWRATIDQEELSEELRFNYAGKRLQGVIGLWYSDYEELNTRDGVGLVGFPTPFGPADVDIVFFSPTEIETRALFTEFDYDLRDRLTLTAGFRYEQLDFDLLTDGLIVLQPFGVPFRDLTLEGDKDEDVLLPKLGVNFALSDTQRLGLTYTEAYRPGGVDLDIFGGTGVTDYDSEHTRNYEVSYKGVFADGQLALNANLFYIDWTDMQTAGSPQIRSGTYNAGEATVYGGELEMSLHGEGASEVFVALGYAHTNFDSFVISGGANDFSGNEFASAPGLTASVGGYLELGDWLLGMEASYRDGYYDSITNLYEVDSLTVVNASATYRRGKIGVKLYANNLFNQVVQTYESFFVEGEELALLTNPRVAGVRVSYSL